MNWSAGIRQFHRWMAVAFTAGFIVNSVIIFGLGEAQPAFWVYLLVLIPLFLLLPTGVYMFVLPYATKWREKREKPMREARQP